MPQRLSRVELEECASDFDRAVELQRDIDRFCSRTEWILPFHLAFLPDRELFLYREGGSFAALAARDHPTIGRYLEPLETMWCFASPLVGPDPLALLDAAVADVSSGATRPPLLLAGIPGSREPGGLLARTVAALDRRYDLRAVDSTLRFVASLEGGLDGWLARRSRSFRRNLRAAQRKGRDAGVGFEHLAPTDEAKLRAAYRRVLAVEATSWKSAEGSGVGEGPMRAFYDDMLPRLARRRGLRLVIATHDGRDVGYLHGALVGDHFRGLQMSSDRSLAHLSLGNLLQAEMLARLCEEGVAGYDLGTRSDYKRRWAEEGLRTLTILAQPR